VLDTHCPPVDTRPRPHPHPHASPEPVDPELDPFPDRQVEPDEFIFAQLEDCKIPIDRVGNYDWETRITAPEFYHTLNNSIEVRLVGDADITNMDFVLDRDNEGWRLVGQFTVLDFEERPYIEIFNVSLQGLVY
jgi:hypothetical protein